MQNNFKNIYFIGIGGISMSGLAELMIYEKHNVSGSDRNSSAMIEKLKNMGAHIYIGHNSSNISSDIDLVVYTSAISEDNPELIRAKSLNLNIMDRAEFLGHVMKNYANSICVSGTHGKTTTTGMLSSILIKTELDPTIFLGGEMDILDGNIRVGTGDMLLTEACEYKRNFLKFNPTAEIILNIAPDHLDYYKDLSDIELAFQQYSDILSSDGALIVNVKNKQLFTKCKCNVFTFGSDSSADFYPTNINIFPFPSYTLMYKDTKITDITLQVFGQHNILNSVAAAAVCCFFHIEPNIIQQGLNSFKGTKRRYEAVGMFNGAVVVDDYAHHPEEIITTLSTARTYSDGKIITVFQPHTYTRTKALLNEFADALKLSDEVILLDIYAAREIDKGSIHSTDLLNKIKETGTSAYYAKTFEEAASILQNLVHTGDTLITMGAGNVNEVVKYLDLK